jgi:hypothetical protein
MPWRWSRTSTTSLRSLEELVRCLARAQCIMIAASLAVPSYTWLCLRVLSFRRWFRARGLARDPSWLVFAFGRLLSFIASFGIGAKLRCEDYCSH